MESSQPVCSAKLHVLAGEGQVAIDVGLYVAALI